MNLFNLTARYTCFAVFASLANLTAQRCVFWVGQDKATFSIAVAAGTITGLLIKYFLDKYFIFKKINKKISKSAKEFLLYSATGSATTLLFCGVEATFWLVWKTHEMRELGAILGLMTGYTIKYQMDKRLVFNDPQHRGES